MAKPYANMNDDNFEVSEGMESVVIRQYVAGIKNGKTLDVTDYDAPVIKAGHLVIRDTINDVYKPMPVEDNAYKSLPSNHEYVGVVMSNTLTKRPVVGIMYAGEVNDEASPYPVDSLIAAIKTALPMLVFKHD